MDILSNVLAPGTIGSLLSSGADFAALAVLLVFIPLFVIFTARAKAGRAFGLRRIPAFERIKELGSQATETGLPVHVSLGSGSIGQPSTAESTMGLTAFDYVARRAATCNQPTAATAGDATLMAAAQGVLLEARREAGFPEAYAGQDVAFAGPDPLAYAAGASEHAQAKPMANISIGEFGPEGLWITESLANQDLPQVGGTTDAAAMALLHISVEESVIAEEVFASGAYLHRPSHLGSLATQDVMRSVITISILDGVALVPLGTWS